MLRSTPGRVLGFVKFCIVSKAILTATAIPPSTSPQLLSASDIQLAVNHCRRSPAYIVGKEGGKKEGKEGAKEGGREGWKDGWKDVGIE